MYAPPDACQGASKINSVVNQYFGAMVACIEAHGGDVIKVRERGLRGER